MKKILIFGANSAIAMAAARVWAKAGCDLVLVARHEGRLANLQNDLRVRGASNVKTYCMDLAQITNLEPLIAQIWSAHEKIDIALIAHGTLSNQAACQELIDLTFQEIQTNAISPALLLTLLANRFAKQGFGAIAAISSVAGDRGRQSNYVYGSAKALLSTFMSGLRQRLYQANIRVVNIKPGFVDTPMTEQFKKGPLWASPDSIAPAIVKACEKSNGDVYIPSFWFVIMTIIKLVPETIFKRLHL